MTELLVDACGHDAASFAVSRWHYSAILPTGKLVKYGVWEDDRFVGAVVFSRGASPWLGHRFELDATSYCELTRVALDKHEAPVSQIVARALRLLRASNPGLRLVISFADPQQGHVGTIYQAGGWIYTGMSSPVVEYRIGGRWRHTRGAYWHPDRKTAPKRTAPGKHRYLFPLDRGMRRKVEPMRVRFVRGPGIKGDPSALRVEGPGSIPGVRSQPITKEGPGSSEAPVPRVE